MKRRIDRCFRCSNNVASLSLPLPLSSSCRCGLQKINLAIIAQHARGQGCWEGAPLESAASRICREGGDFWSSECCGQPSVWRLWSMDSHCSVESNWQWTRHLCQQSQGDGVPRRGRDGVALASARWKKARTYPEFVAAGAQARLVLALEVGGRWSQEGQHVCQVAEVRSEPAVVERQMEQFDLGVRCCTCFCKFSFSN